MTRRGSSRGHDDTAARGTRRGSSRADQIQAAARIRRGSSIDEIYTRGGLAIVAPVLQSGPNATPTYTTCTITWTTDIPAFHRIRYWKSGQEPTVTEFTEEATTNASVFISGLESDVTTYWYDVQSCAVGDGSFAFDWYPGDNSKYFSTLCDNVFSYGNFSATKESFGKLTYLRLAWTTTRNMSQKEVDGNGNLDYGPGSTSGMSHYVNYYGWEFHEGYYDWRVRNKNRCYYQGPWSAWQHFHITAEGDLEQMEA